MAHLNMTQNIITTPTYYVLIYILVFICFLELSLITVKKYMEYKYYNTKYNKYPLEQVKWYEME
jgi:hypothetical protein